MKEFSKTYYLSAGQCTPQGELPMPLLLRRIIDVATLHANSWGVGYAYLIAYGQAWVLSRLTVEMQHWPRIDEHYTLVTWIEDYNNHFSQRSFEVQDEHGVTIGYARSIWMVIDLNKRSGADMTSMQHIREHISPRLCPIAPQNKLRPLTAGSENHYQFTYIDCDFNCHVNTVRYLELIMNQFDMTHYDCYQFSRLEMAFVKETRYGEEAIVRLTRDDDITWRANIMIDETDHVRSRLVFTPR